MTLNSVPRRGASNALGIIALIIALAALFLALCTDPFQSGLGLKVPFSSGLSGYDTETASGMYKAQVEIRANEDIRAQIELGRRMRSKQAKEKHETLKIESEADFTVEKKKNEFRDPDEPEVFGNDYKILFISYKRNGKDKKEVIAMNKHLDSGLWNDTSVPYPEIAEKNKDLAKRIDEWRVPSDKPKMFKAP